MKRDVAPVFALQVIIFKKSKKMLKKVLTNEKARDSIRKVAEGTTRTQRLGSIRKG